MRSGSDDAPAPNIEWKAVSVTELEISLAELKLLTFREWKTTSERLVTPDRLGQSVRRVMELTDWSAKVICGGAARTWTNQYCGACTCATDFRQIRDFCMHGCEW